MIRKIISCYNKDDISLETKTPTKEEYVNFFKTFLSNLARESAPEPVSVGDINELVGKIEFQIKLKMFKENSLGRRISVCNREVIKKIVFSINDFDIMYKFKNACSKRYLEELNSIVYTILYKKNDYNVENDYFYRLLKFYICINLDERVSNENIGDVLRFFVEKHDRHEDIQNYHEGDSPTLADKLKGIWEESPSRDLKKATSLGDVLNIALDLGEPKKKLEYEKEKPTKVDDKVEKYREDFNGKLIDKQLKENKYDQILKKIDMYSKEGDTENLLKIMAKVKKHSPKFLAKKAKKNEINAFRIKSIFHIVLALLKKEGTNKIDSLIELASKYYKGIKLVEKKNWTLKPYKEESLRQKADAFTSIYILYVAVKGIDQAEEFDKQCDNSGHMDDYINCFRWVTFLSDVFEQSKLFSIYNALESKERFLPYEYALLMLKIGKFDKGLEVLCNEKMVSTGGDRINTAPMTLSFDLDIVKILIKEKQADALSKLITFWADSVLPCNLGPSIIHGNKLGVKNIIDTLLKNGRLDLVMKLVQGLQKVGTTSLVVYSFSEDERGRYNLGRGFGGNYSHQVTGILNSIFLSVIPKIAAKIAN